MIKLSVLDLVEFTLNSRLTSFQVQILKGVRIMLVNSVGYDIDKLLSKELK